MFYESLIILNISILNFSEGVPASVLVDIHQIYIFQFPEKSVTIRTMWFINDVATAGP